jgi:xeroderma pigmentosum group C-complementing protein
LSLLPHPLQAAFTIPPSRFPDRAKRSRLFFEALQNLVTWWSQSFFDISDPTAGLRTRPWEEVQEIVDTLPRLTRADITGNAFGGKSKEKVKEEEDKLLAIAEGAGGERLRTVNSLMKKALQQEGSRDVSAQLFVSLARACGLGVRLVVSLQAVPWRAEKVVVKKKPGAGRKGRTVASRQGAGPASEGETDEEDMEEVPIPGEQVDEDVPRTAEGKIQPRRGMRGAGPRRIQDPADVYRLKKQKPAPQTVGGEKPKKKKKEGKYPPRSDMGRCGAGWTLI